MQNKISYPHPVLGNGDDIDSVVMSPIIEYTISDEAIQLRAKNLVAGHDDIDKFITDGDAAWQLRVHCARTYMRESFITSEVNWEQNLVGSDYEGAVTVETKVVALKDIDNYSPSKAHEDYGDTKFCIRPGELLAIGPVFSFYVEKNYDPLKAPVSSLLRIKEGEHKTGPFQLVLDDDLIFVKLSKADWKEYVGIRDRVPTVLHSAIVLPVMAEAVAGLEKHKGTLWADRLDTLIKNRSISIEKPLAAAQELLGSPLQRTFLEINAVLDKG